MSVSASLLLSDAGWIRQFPPVAAVISAVLESPALQAADLALTRCVVCLGLPRAGVRVVACTCDNTMVVPNYF